MSRSLLLTLDTKYAKDASTTKPHIPIASNINNNNNNVLSQSTNSPLSTNEQTSTTTATMTKPLQTKAQTITNIRTKLVTSTTTIDPFSSSSSSSTFELEKDYKNAVSSIDGVKDERFSTNNKINNIDDDNDNDVDVHEYVTSSSLLGIKITLISNQRIEYALGLCSALILFTGLAAMMVWRWKCPCKSIAAGSAIVFDKQGLLQNEVVPQMDSDALTLPSEYLRMGY